MKKINYSWLFLFSTVLTVSLFFISCNKNESDTKSKHIKKVYGIDVETYQLPSSILSLQDSSKTSVELLPLTEDQFFNYLNVLNTAMDKYPKKILDKHLDNVYICGGFREKSERITGLYEKQKMYLFYNHPQGDNNKTFLEQTFHHEFSSILLNEYEFPAFEWLALNPEDFNYIINPVQIDKYMNSLATYLPDKSQLEQGLVSACGKANAENDINTYAELVFTEPERMQKYISTYPVIKKKYKLLKDYYLSISPKFKKIFTADTE